MMRRKRRAFRAACIAAVGAALVIVAEACGPEIVFRAYLNKAFWQPKLKYVAQLAGGLPPEKANYLPYAGMSSSGGSPALQRVRESYRALFPDDRHGIGPLDWPTATLESLRQLLAAVSAANPAEAEEFELLRCKVELRAARPDDQDALERVKSCFESYLAQPRTAALASEARGWMARADFLLGREASAAKFYLDELASETSNIRRERLLASLRMIQPKEEELDEYFDTPAHALFAVNRITNFESLQGLVAPLIMRLEQHKDLFRQGAESNALAIALMRAATRMGAPDATLRYAEQLPADAGVRETAEYNWLVGIARFQKQDYSGAETALLKVTNAQDADPRLKTFAANGLTGVYFHLNRPVDQLWAAFQAASLSNTAVSYRNPLDRPIYFQELEDANLLGMDLDAAYLLDAQLADSQLEEYLKRYGNAPDGIFTEYPQKRTSLETLRYALAVRRARREDYAAAAQIYDQLQSPRASRMRQAEKLLAEARNSNATPERQQAALYDYAEFLSDNEDRIFFNDTLWNGFQTWAFVSRNPDTAQSDLPKARAELSASETTRFAQQERQLRDAQEEYWRAYQILNQIVEKAGTTPLGKKAASRAIFCLRRINTDRFGRSQEIRAADVRLTRWLGRQ